MDDTRLVREVNDLFGDLRYFLDITEVEIFRRAFPDESDTEVNAKLFACMRDVRTCPHEVLTLARALLGEIQKGEGSGTTLDAPIDCPACRGST